MRSHFNQHINIRNLILEKKPELIVECGAGSGETTRLINWMKEFQPFEFHVISDKEIEGISQDIHWHTGLSYNVLNEFKDGSIGMCLIDTDHNYWTLMKELEIVAPKMKEGGLILMHDVEEFYHDTGMALSYWTDDVYPKDEIQKKGLEMGGLGDALIDFLAANRTQFKLVAYVKEEYGAAVIEKHTVKQVRIITPGTAPLFARPVDDLTNQKLQEELHATSSR